MRPLRGEATTGDGKVAMEGGKAEGDGRGRVFDGRAEMPKDATVGQSIDRSVVAVGRRQRGRKAGQSERERESQAMDQTRLAATASGRLEPNKRRAAEDKRERGLEGGRRRMEAGLARASAEAQTAGGDKRLIPSSVCIMQIITGTRNGKRMDSETRRGCPRVVAGVNWLPKLTGWKGEREPGKGRRKRAGNGKPALGWMGCRREKWPAYLLEPELGLLGVRPSGASSPSPVNCRSLVDALLEWA